MKILHLADVHLGIETYGHLDSSTGLSSRFFDFLSSFDRAVDYAIEQGVDLVIFAGDAYKTRDPNPTIQREFARRVRRLAAADVAVFLLTGNHDAPNAPARATTVEIFDTLDVPNVHVARDPGLVRVPTRGGMVQIVALPWVGRSAFLTREEGRGRSMEQLQSLMVERIERLIGSEVERLDPRQPAVLAGHGTVFGASYGSERRVLLGHETIIPKHVIAHPAFDYVALGHIHKHQVVCQLPLAIYSGSLERMDFGEEAETKGFVVVEIDQPTSSPRRSVGFKFVPVDARRFITLRVNAAGLRPMESILGAIEENRAGLAGAVVRLVIETNPEADSHIRDEEVRKTLRQACYTALVSKEVHRPDRPRFEGHLAEEITPRQALERYLAANSVPSERAQTLLSCAEAIMQEQHP